MRLLFVLLLLTSFTIWDQRQNRAEYTGPFFYFLHRLLNP